MDFRKIKFKDKEYILVCEDENNEFGAITTECRYKQGRQSYAHVFSNGNIICFGEKIGTTDDIEYGCAIKIPLSISDSITALKGIVDSLKKSDNKFDSSRN